MESSSKREIHLLSKVGKLSEREWGVNPRVLTLDDACVAYHSKVPAGGGRSGATGSEAAPKASVGLAHIVEVRALSGASVDGAPGDKAQVKKLGKGKASQMFRITFYGGALVPGQATAQQARRQLEPQEKGTLKTWYFLVAADDPANGTADEWIVALNARCLMEENPDFVPDAHVVKRLKEDPAYAAFRHLVPPKGADVQREASHGSDGDGPGSPPATGSTAPRRDVAGQGLELDGLRVSVEDVAGQEPYVSAGGRSSGPDQGHPARQAEAPGRGTAGHSRQSRRAGADGRWDQQFQNLWSCLVAAEGNFPAAMTLSEKLFHLVGQFNQEAAHAVTTIVDEMHLPLEDRAYQPEDFLEPLHAMFYDAESEDFDGSLGGNSLIYLMGGGDKGAAKEAGMLVKLCRYGQKANRVQHRDLKKWEKAYAGCPRLAAP